MKAKTITTTELKSLMHLFLKSKTFSSSRLRYSR